MDQQWAVEVARARVAGLRVVEDALRSPVVAVQGAGLLTIGRGLSDSCRRALLTAAVAHHRADPATADVCISEDASVCWVLHGEAACLRTPVYSVA